MKMSLIQDRFLLIFPLSDLFKMTQLAYGNSKGISLVFGLTLGLPADLSSETCRSCIKLGFFFLHFFFIIIRPASSIITGGNLCAGIMWYNVLFEGC